MKRFFSFIVFIQLIVFASILAQNNLPFKHYSDKVKYIDFRNTDFLALKSIETLIGQAKSNNIDAVILNIAPFPKAILDSDNILKSLAKLSKSAKSDNLFFFVKLDLSLLIKQKLTGKDRNVFTSLISETDLDGICFTGIDLTSKVNYNFLEDLIIDAMMIKPFLSITFPEDVRKTNDEFISELIKKGIIDFLFDEKANYSIIADESISLTNEKLLPKYLKRLQPESFYSLDLSELTNKNDLEVNIHSADRSKQLDSKKRVSFILSIKSDSLKISIGNEPFSISKTDWVIPYKYKINKDLSASRTGNWIEFRRPFEKRTTNNTYNLLCRTNYPSSVLVNGKPVKQYKTGIFFDKILLKEGLNILKAEAKDSKGEFIIYEDRVYHEPKLETIVENKLKIDESTIQPTDNLILTEKDFLTISFNGSKQQKGLVEINPGNFVFECLRNDNKNSSTYQTQISLKDFVKNEKHTIKLILKSPNGNLEITPAELTLKNYFVLKDEIDFPTLITTNINSILTYTLAPVRLGAPIRNELPKDVILKSNGIIGDYYRIRLNESEEGYIRNDFVKEVDVNTPLPTYFINPISTYPTKTADVVKIPYLENVPFDIYPDPYQKRVVINLYGVKSSSTWIMHKNNLRYVEEITWQQVDKETYRIFVNLKTPKIWGYEIKQNGKELLFLVKYPPVYNLKNTTPLKGIKISIEAGHGGNNPGAVSLSGIKEKDLNLNLSKNLERLFKNHGAEVLQVRDSDKDMLLLNRRNIATNSDANIHFSIHANSSEPVTEFLGASGTSTFYHNSFWAKFSDFVFNKLVELNLKPFGSVGSFNYRVTRMSEMPSILVEQAFMSHAEDEEKLADESFNNKMAQKIYDGLINYLKYMSN